MNARRFLRWLRLLVATVAFAVASPPPAMVVDAFDQVVFVAEEEAREDARAEVRSAELPAISVDERRAPRFESPPLVSRRWLTNCAFLL